MKRAAVFLALALGLALTGGAAAQSYPSRPITLIIPGAPGGPGDMVGRVLIERMRTSLGQPLVMENVAGANGTIASARLARAAPDGYTLLLGNWNSQVGASAVYPVPYDVLADLEPIALATFSRLWLVGRGALPPDNIAELIAWLKANPGKATVATVGQGSASHVCGIYFQNATKTEFQFVFYRAGSPAYQDLVAGHIDLMCAERSATVEHLRAGRIKAYGLLAEKRRRAGRAYSVAAGILGAEGNAARHRRQAQRRRRRGLGRSRRAPPLDGVRPRRRAGRPANPGSAARAAEGRDGKMVAADQGRRRQAGMKPAGRRMG